MVILRPSTGTVNEAIEISFRSILVRALSTEGVLVPGCADWQVPRAKSAGCWVKSNAAWVEERVERRKAKAARTDAAARISGQRVVDPVRATPNGRDRVIRSSRCGSYDSS